MRDAFHHRLDVLVLQLARMCDQAALAMRRATDALLDGDIRLAEQVIADEATVNQTRTRIEQDAQTLLALQSPVAKDLRVIVTALRSAEHVERMGELAHHVALAVLRRHPEPVLPVPLWSRFERMGSIAVRMAGTTGKVVRERDLSLARSLGEADAEMDELHQSLFALIGYRKWTFGVSAAVEATLLSRYYERFADHAVAVAERTAFVETGKEIVPPRTDRVRAPSVLAARGLH
ncbi:MULTISPECIES: phosphate signaling complex protein PhoU [unclassified Crossiella]|uniref:phosphate signaling complex protein PhoU n=1 Tax=unclassified Crossiella TaxID=2620835 RepID=UPI001FFE5383|nr:MULTISPECIES: phosphate signaling complex protein PhoU [unclassified Crossiella]MCK2244414.1 phosphate signaling complex protein PhoU [Crossiella sp. S99.2]MCK2257758.1 phosphate signaling complex protein PhoU [Crossiella sp. S99.1]